MHRASGITNLTRPLILAAWLASSALWAADTSPDEARRLFLTGRYAEAAETFQKLAETDAVTAAVGLARCHAAQGKYDEAAEVLTAAAEKNPSAAILPAELAQLALRQGKRADAHEFCGAALKLDENQLLARWLRAELDRTSGDMKAAETGYTHLVNYYNAVESIDDPEALHSIGLGAAQFARWNRLSEQFSFLVNDLYPDALKLDENYWPAHYESALLYLEKFNQAEAQRELKAAMAINANAADVHAALARLSIQNYNLEDALRSIRRALEINPRHLEARLMQADVHFSNFEPDEAVRVLEEARKLYPENEDALGRLAASYAMVDGIQAEEVGTRLGKLIEEVTVRNQHCGDFYFALAEALDKGRKFPDAARYFAAAVEAMPQHVGARGQLGLMYLRLGDEVRGRKLLEESFDIDPFNVRVSNSIKVMEVLDGYETLETEHFVIRYDGQKDALFAQYAARHLEAVYPELCRRLDFEPPEKSLFEIFNAARNTDGHGWFSARMVGLPAIHTIGACAGKMVALTSPSAMKQRFNWARVLKHEMVHVINLQQTNFNVPHWFTEALAVMIEGYPRQPEWNEMLARRVPAGEVYNLDTINMAFIRPHSSEDWQMAYCQAEIYAEFMVEKFGADSLGKMLAAYRDNLGTRAAIERTFGIKQEEFEQGYAEHLASLVASLSSAGSKKAPLSLSALQKALAADPESPDLAAELAASHLQRQAYAEAGRLADQALEKSPKHPLAGYVKARLQLLIGQSEAAQKLLETCLDREAPRPEVVRLLAGLKFKAGDYAAAEELYQLGAKHEPGDLAWSKSLAMVYLKTGDDVQLAATLTRLAEANADDLVVRKKLAQLAQKSGDHASAARWANQCLEIDVLDAAVHALLAEAWLETGQRDKARRVVDDLLKLDPKYPGAAALLESLEK